jgi:Transglycosylase SLT domain
LSKEHTALQINQLPSSHSPQVFVGENLLSEYVPTKGTLLRKSLLVTLILFTVIAGGLVFLGLPSKVLKFMPSNNDRLLSAISGYLQGKASIENTIRVADQTDPARVEPSRLSKQDEQIAEFFAKKYRLARGEIAKYIQFAHLAAKSKHLDTSLVLAVMSIESNLNNITESTAGAQGLMQVLSAVHTDKLNAYGGVSTVFDPQTNIMVGATILADCIKLSGSLELGLKCYVGATGPTDGGYAAKVLAEKERVERASKGDFDFSSNNKVLIDMGLIAAPSDVQQINQSLAELNQAFKQAHSSSAPHNLPGQVASMIISSPSQPITSSPVLPSPLPVTLPVTLPAPTVSASTLMNPNLESVNNTASSKK